MNPFFLHGHILKTDHPRLCIYIFLSFRIPVVRYPSIFFSRAPLLFNLMPGFPLYVVTIRNLYLMEVIEYVRL